MTPCDKTPCAMSYGLCLAATVTLLPLPTSPVGFAAKQIIEANETGQATPFLLALLYTTHSKIHCARFGGYYPVIKPLSSESLRNCNRNKCDPEIPWVNRVGISMRMLLSLIERSLRGCVRFPPCYFTKKKFSAWWSNFGFLLMTPPLYQP
jgi:hypothetical protein